MVGKSLVIVNPVAGQGAALARLPEVKQLLADSRLEHEIVLTERPMHAAQLAEQAALDGAEAVIAAGGDGTANEVLNGLMRARPSARRLSALGILCIGRGNDFAFGAGIPTDLAEGCLVLAEGYRRPMDVGLIVGGDFPQGRYFGNGIGVGFDAAVGFETLKIHWTRGLLAYLIGTIKTVFLYFNPPRLKITLDDETITQVSLMVSIMNGKRMGGGFKMAPESKSDDGLFDLCIVETASKGRIFGLIPYFLGGTQATQPEVKMRRSRRAEIKALDGTFPAHADGETLCLNGSSLTLELLPLELEIICA